MTNRIPLEQTVQQMKAYGMLNEDGTEVKNVSKYVMEERRDEARDKHIASMVACLGEIEKKSSRDEFVKFLRAGQAFVVSTLLEIDQGVQTVQNMIQTPLSQGAKDLLPGMLSARSMIIARYESIAMKLTELGLDPNVPWMPGDGH